jgi:hypothetical protein
MMKRIKVAEELYEILKERSAEKRMTITASVSYLLRSIASTLSDH